MGKTMFGIPGVNEKSESGGAIAPKGTPGGSGSENRGRSGGMSQSGQQRQQPRQSTPPEKAPMAKPAMAKPIPAGAAKPQPSTAARQKAPASKTMFGMPAMNMPKKEPASAPATPKQDTQKPVAAAQTDGAKSADTEGKGDAYGATMLGVPAMTDEMANAAVAEEAAGVAASTADVQPDPAPIAAKAAAPSPAGAQPGQTATKTVVQQAVPASEPQPPEAKAAPAAAPEPAPADEKPIPNEAASAIDDVHTGSADAALGQNTPVVASPPPVDRSGEPPKGLVVGLIAGFFIMIGAIVFVAWKFLMS